MDTTSTKPSARKQAAARGEVWYLGSTCTKCRTRRRYVLSGNCVKCLLGRMKASRKRVADLRKAAREATKP